MAPAVELEQLSVAPLGEGMWRVSWRLTNAGPDALDVASVWLPHGRFRSDEESLVPPLFLAPGAALELATRVRFIEEPATVVENGFLILTCGEWQIYARLRLTAGRQGEPQAAVERITTQRAGTLGA